MECDLGKSELLFKPILNHFFFKEGDYFPYYIIENPCETGKKYNIFSKIVIDMTLKYDMIF